MTTTSRHNYRSKLLAAFSVFLLCTSAQASILSDYFGSAMTSGTSAYFNPGDLNGSIEYAVFTEANFESNFPGYDVPAGELAYVYQILNGNLDPVSRNTIIGINNSVSGIGDVTIDGGATEKAPQSFTLNAGISATWDFSGLGNNVPTNGNSNGLVLTSPNLPGPATSLDIVVDGGQSAIAMVVTPGDIPIPEPASIILLSFGVVLMMSRRIRSRHNL